MEILGIPARDLVAVVVNLFTVREKYQSRIIPAIEALCSLLLNTRLSAIPFYDLTKLRYSPIVSSVPCKAHPTLRHQHYLLSFILMPHYENLYSD